jgi:FMN-binding domain.
MVGVIVVLAFPSMNAWAAVRAKTGKTVTKTVHGTTVICKKWGPIQVQLKVAQTIVKGKVKIKILEVTEPIWPQHTVKSVFINTKALPLLEQEVLQLQGANLETISGATDVSVSFKASLQAALIAAAKV